VVWVDRIIGVLIAQACVPLWLISDTFPGSGGAFPKTVLATVTFLSLLLVTRSFLGKSDQLANGEGRRDGQSLLRPLAVALATAAAVVTMPAVGFFPAMAALCVALFFLLAREARLLYVAAATSALAFIYGVFVLILGVPLEASRILGQ
jgi:hypothetical protein